MQVNINAIRAAEIFLISLAYDFTFTVTINQPVKQGQTNQLIS
jgi:hypothetical protein